MKRKMVMALLAIMIIALPVTGCSSKDSSMDKTVKKESVQEDEKDNKKPDKETEKVEKSEEVLEETTNISEESVVTEKLNTDTWIGDKGTGENVQDEWEQQEKPQTPPEVVKPSQPEKPTIPDMPNTSEDENTEEEEHKQHVYGEWKVVKEATWDESGKENRTCEKCGVTESRDIPALKESHIHDFSGKEIVEKEATCTESGLKSVQCTEEKCGTKVFQVIPATGHTYGNWQVTKEATWDESGEESRTCEECGATESKTIPALKENHVHDFSGKEIVEKEATCTESGLKTIKCTEPRCEAKKTVEIPSTGHTYGEWIVTKEPTWSEAGRRERICKSCGSVDGEELAAISEGHEHSFTGREEIEKEASCTEDGIKLIHCTNEKCSATKEIIIPALGHEWSDWIVEKEASCTETGLKKQRCTRCGEEKTEIIPMTEHVNGQWKIEKEATCHEVGKRVLICAVCGEVLNEEEIPKIEHSWSDWVTVKEPTTEETGIKESTCQNCGEKRTEVIPKLEKPDSGYVYDTKVSRAIFDEINRVRVENGLTPLEWEERYCSMASKLSAAYNAANADTAENLANHSGDQIGYGQVSGTIDPAEVVAAWMDSDIHRAAILNADPSIASSAVAVVTYTDSQGVTHTSVITTFTVSSETLSEFTDEELLDDILSLNEYVTKDDYQKYLDIAEKNARMRAALAAKLAEEEVSEEEIQTLEIIPAEEIISEEVSEEEEQSPEVIPGEEGTSEEVSEEEEQSPEVIPGEEGTSEEVSEEEEQSPEVIPGEEGTSEEVSEEEEQSPEVIPGEEGTSEEVSEEEEQSPEVIPGEEGTSEEVSEEEEQSPEVTAEEEKQISDTAPEEEAASKEVPGKEMGTEATSDVMGVKKENIEKQEQIQVAVID